MLITAFTVNRVASCSRILPPNPYPFRVKPPEVLKAKSHGKAASRDI